MKIIWQNCGIYVEWGWIKKFDTFIVIVDLINSYLFTKLSINWVCHFYIRVGKIKQSTTNITDKTKWVINIS